jgi:hypothetical protein
MDFLHLTNKQNLNSILKHGILPSYINNETHWELFKEYGLKNRRCVYTWNGETYNNTKYIKDMIYTKLFIHPRNKLYNYMDDYLNFKDYGQQIFGEDTTYFLLKINHDNWLGNWLHEQYPGDEKFYTTVVMDDKYAHNDKEIYVSSTKINTVKVVEKINVRIYKNNTLGFTFSKC